MYGCDLHNICEKADAWAKLFETAEYLASVVEHNCCSEIDVFVELLIALDYHGHASDLMDAHIEADSCRDRHPTADQVILEPATA
ncbi:hypothetical protein [Rhodococcus qingshengii]|uniref:hypothetical protein n=1 Tax=Rhodococcus qingshengii TaxID=334542 RepID=UPI0002B7CD99|nr:hypothetical protein [Rhodococcus qingshengii]EME16407.1 hypothetical protein G418_25683 [Rhodococcus qingshengii BKS 20-40]